MSNQGHNPTSIYNASPLQPPSNCAMDANACALLVIPPPLALYTLLWYTPPDRRHLTSSRPCPTAGKEPALPTIAHSDIPPPRSWDEFEGLVRALRSRPARQVQARHRPVPPDPGRPPLPAPASSSPRPARTRYRKGLADADNFAPSDQRNPRQAGGLSLLQPRLLAVDQRAGRRPKEVREYRRGGAHHRGVGRGTAIRPQFDL